MTETATTVEIVVVTGWRHWRYPVAVYAALDMLYVHYGPFKLFHGECRDKRTKEMIGADRDADYWGNRTAGIEVRSFPADWDRFGDDAGPIRNRDMVQTAVAEVGSDRVRGLAFPGPDSRGTRNAMKCMRDFHVDYTEWSVKQGEQMTELLGRYSRVLTA
jgi:hypothetical protein